MYHLFFLHVRLWEVFRLHAVLWEKFRVLRACESSFYIRLRAKFWVTTGVWYSVLGISKNLHNWGKKTWLKTVVWCFPCQAMMSFEGCGVILSSLGYDVIWSLRYVTPSLLGYDDVFWTEFCCELMSMMMVTTVHT